eukprot:15362614-Ditylum_brightwellii.AAC.1
MAEYLPNHHCSDYTNYMETLSILVSCGIPYMTSHHASLLSSFVLMEWNDASEDDVVPDGMLQEFLENDTTTSTDSNNRGSGGNVESKQKALLKQNIFYHSKTDALANRGNHHSGSISDDNIDAVVYKGEPYRMKLLEHIIIGLGKHAMMDRYAIQKLSSSSATTKENMMKEDNAIANDAEDAVMTTAAAEATIDSYYNCLRTLVDIGEQMVTRLPSNVCTEKLGGKVVKAILLSCMDLPSHIDVMEFKESIWNYRGYLGHLLFDDDRATIDKQQ